MKGHEVSMGCAVRRQAPARNGSITNWHAYVGLHCVADLDAGGTVLRSYTYGPGVDNLLAMTVHGATETNTYFALTDHLGTVHALVSSVGAVLSVVESYRYDAWGNVLAVHDAQGSLLPASSLGNRFLFQGREHSFATGLTNFRARWYDPSTGRWLSNDPIGISGGLNQYVFCGNDPVDYVDPLGLLDAKSAHRYWMDQAEAGLDRGGLGGNASAAGASLMAAFIDFWGGRSIQENSEKAGEYYDDCPRKAARHGALAVLEIGEKALLAAAAMRTARVSREVTVDGPSGTRRLQVRDKATGEPKFRVDKGPVPGQDGPRWHYHRQPNMRKHRPYEGW